MGIAALYSRADGRDEVVDLRAWRPDSIPRDELLWVDAEDPTHDELELIGSALGLHADSILALRSWPDRPDAAVVGSTRHVIVQAPPERPDEDPVPLRIVLGDEWVVTVHPGRIRFLEDHRRRLQDQREVGLLTPVQFLAAVLDWTIDAMFRLAGELESEIDRLDDAALRTERELLGRLVRQRRRIARTRRLIFAHREMFAELRRPDFMPGLEAGEAQLLAMVGDRLDRAGEAIATVREMLFGTFDVHMTRTAQRTNEIMKVLTLASAVLLPAGVLAGVMGMNFELGFFDDPNMFWAVVGAMAVVGFGILAGARLRGWL